jgi:predicted AlkP superfamily pyrophosphatase or phosphodiesterase
MAAAASRPPKLVLAVIDGLKPSMLERAVQTGRAPALEAVMERGPTSTPAARRSRP